LGEGGGQQLEPLRGQRGEQTAPVGEVVRRGGMRHPRLTCQLAERNPVGAPLSHETRGLGQDRGTQVPVVVGLTTHNASIAD
ncbi:MAG: hypothetical protein QOH07_2800, partial [Mycobacterium sp.]|nr:hypothetical protein [Mycobacterium sp.]